jgi:hypothetical protein
MQNDPVSIWIWVWIIYNLLEVIKPGGYFIAGMVVHGPFGSFCNGYVFCIP